MYKCAALYHIKHGTMFKLKYLSQIKVQIKLLTNILNQMINQINYQMCNQSNV